MSLLPHFAMTIPAEPLKMLNRNTHAVPCLLPACLALLTLQPIPKCSNSCSAMKLTALRILADFVSAHESVDPSQSSLILSSICLKAVHVWTSLLKESCVAGAKLQTGACT